jgi:RND superfamily putative drug exporter
LGYEGPPALDLLVAVVILASTFGLAADYSILLLARIAEEHRAGRSDEEAVALAVERTGPVITSAAVLLSVTLLALATSKLYLIKELTIGQVIGIAIDVTLVRLLLVPAFIRLLGPLNWWLPRALRRSR